MTFAFQVPQVKMKGRDVSEATKAANDALNRGVTAGIRDSAIAIKPALNEAMAQSVWGWPNTTIRKNTSDVRAPRDIVDTANLRDSMDTSTVGEKLVITYTAPYASMVHYGGITRPYGRGKDSFVYPARPWISSLLEGKNGINKFPLMDIIDRNVKKEWATRYQNKTFQV